MDPKASAKSKRTHTQHGRRNHPPPAAIAHKKKPSQPAGGDESARRAQPDTLPSNWDRYDSNDEDEGAHDPVGAKQAEAQAAPKSKGADFSYLIEQARSQPQELRGPGPESSIFDELSPGFMQGVSSMLSVRGENLLSWCGDDNFIVDDDPMSSYEVPFLSMDLHALAAQLSKLKLSQRLFIEADLLPEELCVGESQKNRVSKEQTETLETNELRHSSDPLYADSEKNEDSQGNVGSSTVFADHEIGLGEVADVPFETSTTTRTAKLAPRNDSKPLEQSDSREVEESMPGTSIHTISESEWNKTSRFEAAAVEAELDKLFDSLGQSSISSSLVDVSSKNSFTRQSAASDFSAPSLLSVSQDPGSSRNAAATTPLDEAIDDLLAETSLCLEEQKHIIHPQQKEVVSSTSLLPPRFPPMASGPMNASSSSRCMAMAAALDYSIDDLLAETSLCLGDQKQTAHPLPAASASKPVDDFDSWLDTL